MIFQHDQGFLGAWLMNGAGMASATYLAPSRVGDADYRIAGSGDFDRDGQEDLLFQHADGALVIWQMRGSSLRSSEFLSPKHPGDQRWRVAGTTDVNRDGQVDLVFQHTDGTLVVWEMNGLKLSHAALLEPAHRGDDRWRVAGTGKCCRWPAWAAKPT